MTHVNTIYYRMDTTCQIINAFHVTVILLAPTTLCVVRPVASVAVGPILRAGGAMLHRMDFISEHWITSDLKLKVFPIQRYYYQEKQECLLILLYHIRNLLKYFLSQLLQCMRMNTLVEDISPILTLTLLQNYTLLSLYQSHHNMK